MGFDSSYIRLAGLALPAAVTEAVERLRDGRVTARDEAAVRTVWFSSGKVHALTSELEREMLGGWLIERGVADGAAVRRALALSRGGRRLGQILVRAGVLDEATVRQELRSLAFTIAARLVAGGGTLDAEPGAGMPVDARTVEVVPAGLFPEAMLHTPDLDLLADMVGRGRVWEAAGPVPDAVVSLSDSQRYLLTLLRPAKSLDALRRVLVADYADVVRDLAVLAAGGLVVPRDQRAGGSGALPDGPPGPSGARVHPGQGARVLPPRTGADPRLRATLAEIEREEQEQAARSGLIGPHGPLVGAELRRAERLLAAADKQLAEGDVRGARRALAYAAETVPCAGLLTRLGELELAEPASRSSGLERLRKALALAPDFVGGWATLAEYWRQRGELEKERRCRDRIAALSSAGPEEPHREEVLVRRR